MLVSLTESALEIDIDHRHHYHHDSVFNTLDHRHQLWYPEVAAIWREIESLCCRGRKQDID
jgi:hypothetical protein